MLTRLLKEDGMLPPSELPDKFKFCNAVRLPKEAGMLPVRKFPTRRISLTLESATIPNQLFTGPVNQFLWFSQAGPLVLLYRSTSAIESCTFTACAFVVVFVLAQIAITMQNRVDFFKVM